MVYTYLFALAAAISLITLARLQPNNRRTIFEPGMLVVILFSLCYLLPSLAIMTGTDVNLDFNRSTVESISQYGVCFVGTFTFAYLALGASISARPIKAVYRQRYPKPWTCVILFTIILLASKLILLNYGAAGTGDYSEQYVARAAMPVLVSQVLNVFRALQLMLVYLVLSYSFSQPENRNSSLLVWILAGELFADMLLTRARSGFVTFVIIYFAARSFYGRTIGIKKELAIMSIFVLVMSVFSILRGAGAGALSGSSVVAIPSEFVFIYYNAIHLAGLEGTGDFVRPPGISYLQSFISFIPKQFNDEKWDLSLWYVSEYFPEYLSGGGGLAFGIIPEAIVNFGLLSMVFQALVVAASLRIGYILALRRRFGGPNAWLLFYLYAFGMIYQLIRSDSFVIVGGLFYGFLVPYAIVRLLGLNWPRVR